MSSWEEDQGPVCVVGPSRAASHSDCQDLERQCRHCLSPSLYVDWPAGDRVCTNCGVVDEDHVRDERPEWKDFNEAEDLAKGLPSAARCGMVPVDESRYLGGLQPTTLSKHVYGAAGSHGGQDLTRRKRLLATNQKIDFLMVKQHARKLKNAKVLLMARKRRLQGQHGSDWKAHDNQDHVPSEHEQMLLQEEEDAERIRSALYAEKWSLERAVLLHGTSDGQGSSSLSSMRTPHERDNERDDLLQRLDAPLRRASLDLYRVYSMMQDASRKLNLPDRVLHEASNMLCRYATRRDGLSVKGVSSRLSTKNSNGTKAGAEKEASERLREYNKVKQMASLGSALLVLTARNLGWTRSIAEVCENFQLSSVAGGAESGLEVSVKPKHCSRGMMEVRALFPQFGRMTSRHDVCGSLRVCDSVATGNFVEHATRKLDLSPVATASIRTLVTYFRKEQIESGLESGTKLSTVTASISLFVCMTGATLQRLAKQKQVTTLKALEAPDKHTSFAQHETSTRPLKRVKRESPQEESTIGLSDSEASSSSTIEESEPRREQSGTTCTTKPLDKSSFDVFSCSSVKEQPLETNDYDMRRLWDAWNEQMPWNRSVARIEQSCGVSGKVILNHYKAHVYPRRSELLELLRKSASPRDANMTASGVADTLPDTPLASILLSNVTVAAPLLNDRGV